MSIKLNHRLNKIVAYFSSLIKSLHIFVNNRDGQFVFQQLCKKTHQLQPRPQAKPQRKASWPNWESKVPGPTANVEVLVAKNLCERLHNFQHRPQTKPQRKASGPNWKSKVPGPQPMWKFRFLNKCVKSCTISNPGPRPSPRRRHQGQLGKVRCQLHSPCGSFGFSTIV